MRKIKCACLQPRGDGIYTIDPRWKGESDKGADKATIALMFEVMGEGLRQLPDGFEGERAWRLTLLVRRHGRKYFLLYKHKTAFLCT